MDVDILRGFTDELFALSGRDQPAPSSGAGLPPSHPYPTWNSLISASDPDRGLAWIKAVADQGRDPLQRIRDEPALRQQYHVLLTSLPEVLHASIPLTDDAAKCRALVSFLTKHGGEPVETDGDFSNPAFDAFLDSEVDKGLAAVVVKDESEW